MDRALEIKTQTVADGALATWDSNVPRSWERAMNHMFCTGHPVGIYGEAVHIPGPFGSNENWCALQTGTDFVEDVPAARWDHSLYYDVDPDSWKAPSNTNLHTWGLRTSIRHASFMDGMEAFDCKFFGLSVAE